MPGIIGYYIITEELLSPYAVVTNPTASQTVTQPAGVSLTFTDGVTSNPYLTLSNNGAITGSATAGFSVFTNFTLDSALNQLELGGALVNINESTLATGQILQYNAAGQWVNAAGGGAAGVSSLNGLAGPLDLTSPDSSITITPAGADIELEVAEIDGGTLGGVPFVFTGLGANQFLFDNGTDWVNGTELDVFKLDSKAFSFGALANGQALTYDGTNWVNANPTASAVPWTGITDTYGAFLDAGTPAYGGIAFLGNAAVAPASGKALFTVATKHTTFSGAAGFNFQNFLANGTEVAYLNYTTLGGANFSINSDSGVVLGIYGGTQVDTFAPLVTTATQDFELTVQNAGAGVLVMSSDAYFDFQFNSKNQPMLWYDAMAPPPSLPSGPVVMVLDKTTNSGRDTTAGSLPPTSGYTLWVANVAAELSSSTLDAKSFSFSILSSGDVLYYNGSDWINENAAGLAPVQSVSNSDGTLSISPTTGSVVASLNLSNANTWAAAQTLPSGDLIIQNPAATHTYTIVGAALAASHNLTLPLITGADTLAALGVAQTYTAIQTFSAGDFAFGGYGHDVITSGAAGDMWYYDGTNIVNLPIGSGYLGVSAGVPSWTAFGSGFVTSLNSLTGALSVTSPNSTLTVGTSGGVDVTVDINLGNANTWTATQTYTPNTPFEFDIGTNSYVQIGITGDPSSTDTAPINWFRNNSNATAFGIYNGNSTSVVFAVDSRGNVSGASYSGGDVTGSQLATTGGYLVMGAAADPAWVEFYTAGGPMTWFDVTAGEDAMYLDAVTHTNNHHYTLSVYATNTGSDSRLKPDFATYAGDPLVELDTARVGQYRMFGAPGKAKDTGRFHATVAAETLPTTVSVTTKEGFAGIIHPDSFAWSVIVLKVLRQKVSALEAEVASLQAGKG